MIWLLVIGLTLAVFAAVALAFRLPRSNWSVVLSALALGLAGYSLQGSPGTPGAPKVSTSEAAGTGESLVELRRAIVPSRFHSASSNLLTADAFARRDRFAEAAALLRGAVRDNPRDGEAWLALGNTLVAVSDGKMTPAAQLAYRRAEQLAPESPGVPFFIGVAELQSGGFLDALGLWQEAARRAPEGSEERKVIEDRMARLEAVLQQVVAAREQEQQGLQPPPQQ